MSSSKQKVARSRTISSLPNYTTAGSYCFFSQCVFLDSLSAKDLQNAMQFNFGGVDDHVQILKFAPLLQHEAKHWIDAHSTLWGLKLIHQIYSAWNDLIKAEQLGISTSLNHFDKQIKLRDAIEFIKYPTYYQTTNSKANCTRPWWYSFSSGLLFTKSGKPSDRPIFFTRFMNAESDLIARVPFSLCAMLEASAVAQELNTKAAIISSIKNQVSRQIEINNFVKCSHAELYDENLVEYSVVAHKVANAFSIADPIEAYNIAAKLVRLILNLPQLVLHQLKPENLLAKEFSAFFGAYENAIKHKDYGALFPFFVDVLYSKFQAKGINVTTDNLESLLNELFSMNINLTLIDINNLAYEELIEVCKPVQFEKEKEYVNSVLKQGVDFYKEIGLIGNHFINFTEKNMPDFVLGDNSFCSFSGASLEDFESRYYTMSRYYEHLQEFAKACII